MKLRDREAALEMVKKDGFSLQGISNELRNDKDVVLVAVKQNGYALEYVSEELRNDKETILEAVKKKGLSIFYASDELRNDKDVVLVAVNRNGYALEYASAELRDNKDVVSLAVKKNGMALEYASNELRDNKDVVLEAVKQDGMALEYASNELKDDKDIVWIAVKQYGIALKFTSEKFKNDKEIVSEAVKQDGNALEFASRELRNDKEIVLEAVKQNGNALEFASDELKNDKEVVSVAVRQNTRPRLFVDMDGTLVVFQKLDTLEALYEQGYFLSLPPIDNVLGAVKDVIANSPEIEVHILSAVLSDSKFALDEKNAWLNRYLPELPKENRIFTICGEDKKDFIIGGVTENDYLLDDYTKNLTLWSPPGQGIKLLNGINHTKGTWKGQKLDYEMPSNLLAKQITSIVKQEEFIMSFSDKRYCLLEKMKIQNKRYSYPDCTQEFLDKRADITRDISYMLSENKLSETQVEELLSINDAILTVHHSLYVSKSKNVYDIIKRIADSRDIPSDEIKIEGHKGNWYNIDTFTDEVTDKVYYLMEHTTYGDEAPHIIIDENYKIIAEDVFNGFNEKSFQEFIEFERLQSLSKYPLEGLEENAGYYILDKNNDYAIGYSPTAPSTYVVWDCDVKGGYCNGRYSASLESLGLSDYGLNKYNPNTSQSSTAEKLVDPQDLSQEEKLDLIYARINDEIKEFKVSFSESEIQQIYNAAHLIQAMEEAEYIISEMLNEDLSEICIDGLLAKENILEDVAEIYTKISEQYTSDINSDVVNRVKQSLERGAATKANHSLFSSFELSLDVKNEINSFTLNCTPSSLDVLHSCIAAAAQLDVPLTNTYICDIIDTINGTNDSFVGLSATDTLAKINQLMTQNIGSSLKFCCSKEHCINNSDGFDFANNIVVLNPTSLRGEYRKAENQIYYVNSSDGNNVYATNIFDKSKDIWKSDNFLGVANIDKLPKYIQEQVHEFKRTETIEAEDENER